MGTVFFGIAALAAVGVFLYIKSKSEEAANNTSFTSDSNAQPKSSDSQRTQTSTESKEDSIQFSNEDDRLRYFANKAKIERAIADKDYEYLEDMLNTRATDFKDLKDMIDEALKNKPKDS